MNSESDAGFREAELVRAGLDKWPDLAGAGVSLLNHSENDVFRIDLADSPVFALRLHRPGYQSREAILSEMIWLEDVARRTNIPVPRPVAGTDGSFLQTLGDDRPAVLFAFERGHEPTIDADLTGLFELLGRYAATLHTSTVDWVAPEGFVRPRLDAEALLDPAGPWGDWREAPGVTPAVAATLETLEALLRRRLADYGTGSDRFGLIHADMRLANLLVSEGRVVLLDFDDCGYGWHLYDLAASLSFHETAPQVPALIRAWFTGYVAVRPLEAEHIAMLDDMILLRRLALLAWIGTHRETETAQRLADTFATETQAMAERYLQARG